MDIERILIQAFEKARIKCEILGCEKFYSYSRLCLKIASSPRISQNRLSKIESCLENEIGFLPKITRQDDLLYVEIRNEAPSTISLTSVQQGKLATSGFMLPIAVGNDGQDDIVADLSAMPHLLLGGCDGYGKTTFLQNAITSISRAGSSKLILVDSKYDDFKGYSNLDCLVCPVIHDFGTLVEKLEWLLEELEERYYLLASAGSRNIAEYNQKAIEKMPYLVLVLADYSAYNSPLRSALLLNFFSRMCAKSKAAGIHIIIASEEIPESYIKNRFLCYFPARIAFRCESAVQSKALIGSDDATYLYYPGEVYYKQDFSSTSVRLQHYND